MLQRTSLFVASFLSGGPRRLLRLRSWLLGAVLVGEQRVKVKKLGVGILPFAFSTVMDLDLFRERNCERTGDFKAKLDSSVFRTGLDTIPDTVNLILPQH
ncbi:hypothetical protein CVV68_22605 [Arthrobacter livingstonensis]|uniref:Uncharacterized protein n=1 Tax=Arthrobacter livingstonensis TaxID=670078 RepID=A0A2V5LCX4_9MICC|nr:hypothetical protein CVV68_22605 [Arthrobacter livingstonensis]